MKAKRDASSFIPYELKIITRLLLGILVAATVSEVTIRCAVQVVDIERAAVSHANVGVPQAVAATPLEADLSRDLPFSHCRMRAIQPPGCGSVTPVRTWR